MDLIKTSLIVAIAITLYYLLLQWPNEPISVVNEPEEINKLSTLNDSKDSLTKNGTLYRNTAFLFEALVKELTKSIIENDQTKKKTEK